MPLCDCVVLCHSLDNLEHSEIIFGHVWNRFGWSICTWVGGTKRTWSWHHLPDATSVALIILPVGALVGTVDICPVVCALAISIVRLITPGFFRVCFPLLLQESSLLLGWVFTSSISEFTCHSLLLIILPVLYIKFPALNCAPSSCLTALMV